MFQQILDPIAGSLVISALCAALPLVLLFVLLGVFKVKAPKAALASLALSSSWPSSAGRCPSTRP